MLYLIATPIGNLQDLSPRAIEVMKSCDLILAEDTRRTAILKKHFEIETKIAPFTAFAEKKKLIEVLKLLKEEKKIALVSDAGMPGISDPGTYLVKACHQEHILVEVIPGPSAVTTVAALSGLCMEGFCFIGFFPEKENAQDQLFKNVEANQMPTIFFEAPHRLLKTLKILNKRYPNATVFLARELTKKFAEYDLGSADEILKRWENKELRGEFALCFKLQTAPQISLELKDILKDIAALKKEGCSLKTACKVLAKKTQYSHQDLYQFFIENKEE